MKRSFPSSSTTTGGATPGALTYEGSSSVFSGVAGKSVAAGCALSPGCPGAGVCCRTSMAQNRAGIAMACVSSSRWLG